MKKYLFVIKLTIQDILQYRFDFLVHVGKYAMAVSLMSLVWLAVQKTTLVPDMTPESTVRYFFFAAILYPLSNFHTWYVEEDIKLGYLSKYLLRPYSSFSHYFFHYLTHSTLDLIIKALIMLPLLKYFGFSFTPTWSQGIIFLLYLPLIYIFSFCTQFTVASIAFWIQESYSVRWMTLNVSRFFAGIVIPLNLLPDKFVKITFWLPYQHLAYTPIKLIQGELSLQIAFQGTLILSFWIIIAWIIKSKIWYQGTHSYEATGI